MGYWIVTGGASGIGNALARDIVARGHEVLVWDIKEPPAQPGLAYQQVDLTDREAIVAAAAKVSREVDCFVHCAGVFASTSIHHDNLAQAIDICFKIHVFAFVLATQALLPRFHAKTSLIAITSAAQDMVYPGTLAYGPSKAALAQAIHQLAVELGPRGIRVNGIAPGAIATDMTRHLWADPDYKRVRIAHIPLGPPAEPSAVAEAVSYLASDAASYTTGQILWVDGGVRQGIFLAGVQALTQQGERA